MPNKNTNKKPMAFAKHGQGYMFPDRRDIREQATEDMLAAQAADKPKKPARFFRGRRIRIPNIAGYKDGAERLEGSQPGTFLEECKRGAMAWVLTEDGNKICVTMAELERLNPKDEGSGTD